MKSLQSFWAKLWSTEWTSAGSHDILGKISNATWIALQRANNELGGNVPVERNKLPQDLAQDVAMVNLGHQTNLISSGDILVEHPEVFFKPLQDLSAPPEPSQTTKQASNLQATQQTSKQASK